MRVLLTAIIGLAGAAAQAGEIRGRVLIGEGPAAGVTIAAMPYEAPGAEARRLARRGDAPAAIATTLSRPDGTFGLTVTAEPGTTFRILAQGGGVAPSWLGGTYDAAETEDVGEHALPRAQTVTGRVVNTAGAPIAGVEVTLVAGSGGFGADPEVTPAARTVITTADGAFRSEEAAPTGNHLTVQAKGYGAAALTNVRSGAIARPITLGPGVALSGTVLRSDRKTAAAGALVRYESADIATRWVETSADGAFALTDLPPRPGTIVVDAGDAGVGEAATGRGPAAAAGRLTVVISPPPALGGRVVDAKTRAPVPRARLTLDDGAHTRTVRSGPDGRYEIRGLVPQRRYRLRADEPRYVPWVRGDILLATSETRPVDVPLRLAASISGRVVDEDGKPVAGALGRLVLGGENALAERIRQIRAGERFVFRTAADGTFNATRIAPGEDQRLSVLHPDFEPRIVAGLSLAPGAARTGLTVVLRRGLALAGLVRDDVGHPVPAADVQAGPARGFGFGRGGFAAFARGGGAARPRATSGADGRFELKGLSEGDYVLTVEKEGYAEQTVEPIAVRPEARAPVEVTLTRGASLRGTLAKADGTAAEGYFVRAVPAGGGGPGPRPFGFAELRPTGPDGTFSIDGLRAGESYDLVAFGRDGLGARRAEVMAPAEGIEIVLPGPGRIAGRVIDAQTLAPVTDFQVDFDADRSSGRGGFGPGGGGRGPRALRFGGGRDRQGIHSEDGSFVLEDVPPGTWEVVAQAEGYQTARVGGITLEEGGSREGVEVRLSRGSSIQGRVLDASSGSPVLDASVTLVRPGGPPAPLAQMLGGDDSRTDADGRFAIGGLSPGSYTVMVRHPDYADGSMLVEVKEGPATADLRLTPGSALGGIVLSETSTPLAAATVTLGSGGGGGGFGFGPGGFGGGQTTLTDEAGRFRFTHLAAGRYALRASLRGHQSPPLDVILQAGETRDNLTLSLASGTRIHGAVSGLPGTLQDSVMVTANGPGGYAAATRAAADGSFELTGAPAGPINLRATAGSFGGTSRSATAQVVVPEGQDVVQAEVVFDIGFALSGMVTRNGQPVDAAMVMAALDGTGGRTASARTNASGGYRLEGLAQGSYTVTVTPPGGGRTQRQSAQVSDDTTLDFAIPSARLSGVVVDAGSRQPLADATVQIASKGGGAPTGRGASSDSNGRFSLEDLDFVPYVVTVRKTGYQLDSRELTPSDGGGDDAVFELLLGDGIGVEVRDAAFGVPVHGVQVRAADAQGAVAFTGNVTLDGEGRGLIPSLKPGGYLLALYASGYAPAVVAATAPAARVPIGLAAGGNLEIHAGAETLAKGTAHAQITAGGQPYPFSIFSSDGRLSLSTPVRRLEHLGAGHYLLQVEGGQAMPFEIQERGLTVLTLP